MHAFIRLTRKKSEKCREFSYFTVTGAVLFGRTVMNDFWFPLLNPDVTLNIFSFQCSLHDSEVKLHPNVFFTPIRKNKILDSLFIKRAQI
jgi:hypothetical protein